jgi:hypothetical protein
MRQKPLTKDRRLFLWTFDCFQQPRELDLHSSVTRTYKYMIDRDGLPWIGVHFNLADGVLSTAIVKLGKSNLIEKNVIRIRLTHATATFDLSKHFALAGIVRTNKNGNGGWINGDWL